MPDPNNFTKLLYSFGLLKITDGRTEPLSVTQRPTFFPTAHYRSVQDIQQTINKLIHNAMQEVESEVCSDVLVTKLLKIQAIVPVKKISALFIRTDYLLDSDGQMKQVEINTISCAFLFAGPCLNKLHELFYKDVIVSKSDDEFVEFVKMLYEKVGFRDGEQVNVKIETDFDIKKRKKNNLVGDLRNENKIEFKDEFNIGFKKGNLKGDNEIKIKESNKEINKESNQESNKEFNKESNKEIYKEFNKEINKEFNKEINKKLNKNKDNNLNLDTLNNEIKGYSGVHCNREVEYKKIQENSSIALIIDNKTSFECSNIFEKIQIIRRLKENKIDAFHVTYKEIENECKFTYRGKEIKNDEISEYLKKGQKLEECLVMTFRGRHVFFVYYRWFYNNSHYSELDIITRCKIECSSAVSLPNAGLQIIGNKSFQIKFLEKKYLERFLGGDEIEKVYRYFGEFKSIDDLKDGDKEDWIMKSLNEGGGNNLYGEDIKNFTGEKKDHFLMKKIKSPSYINKFLGDEKERRIIPEIGIFGWLISEDGKIVENRNAGYLCRTKDENSNECGVSCGFGALDSLFDDKKT